MKSSKWSDGYWRGDKFVRSETEQTEQTWAWKRLTCHNNSRYICSININLLPTLSQGTVRSDTATIVWSNKPTILRAILIAISALKLWVLSHIRFSTATQLLLKSNKNQAQSQLDFEHFIRFLSQRHVMQCYKADGYKLISLVLWLPHVHANISPQRNCIHKYLFYSITPFEQHEIFLDHADRLAARERWWESTFGAHLKKVSIFEFGNSMIFFMINVHCWAKI